MVFITIWALCELPAMTKQPTRVYWSSWTTRSMQPSMLPKLIRPTVSTFQTSTSRLGLSASVAKQENLYLKQPSHESALILIACLVPIISAYAGMTDELNWYVRLKQLDGFSSFRPWSRQCSQRNQCLEVENLLQRNPSRLGLIWCFLMVLLNLSTPTKRGGVESCKTSWCLLCQKNSTLKHASNY